MSWEGDQSCGHQFQVEILPQHCLEPRSHKCSSRVNGECIVRIKMTATSFSEDTLFFFLQISKWTVPTMNPSQWSLLQELAVRQCSQDLFTHGFGTSKNRWSKIAVHRGCSLRGTSLEEFSTLWNEYFLVHLAYTTNPSLHSLSLCCVKMVGLRRANCMP